MHQNKQIFIIHLFLFFFQTIIAQINQAIGASGVVSQECKSVISEYGKTILDLLESKVWYLLTIFFIIILEKCICTLAVVIHKILHVQRQLVATVLGLLAWTRVWVCRCEGSNAMSQTAILLCIIFKICWLIAYPHLRSRARTHRKLWMTPLATSCLLHCIWVSLATPNFV